MTSRTFSIIFSQPWHRSLLKSCLHLQIVFHVASTLFQQFYSRVNINILQLEISPVSEEFIYKELCHLNSFKSTGLDDIPARFVKGCGYNTNKAHQFHCKFINNEWYSSRSIKISTVKPLFKKNNRSEVGNYRPISILCIISKILEKVVYKQLESYLVKNNLLYELQSGFRSAYSTDTCLIHLFDHIKSQTSKGLFTGMVMIDLQKAFDTVDHQILCNKLQAMGVSNIKWFESYLTGRQTVG